MTRCQAHTKAGPQCKLQTVARFPYCWVHLKSKDSLAVKKSTVPNAGKGLFYVGKRPFPKDRVITKYSGVVTATPDRDSAYVVAVAKNKFLDAKSTSTAVGRYINDSRGTARRPNVKISGSRTLTQYHGQPATNIITTKTIQPNSELFLSYGKDYWKK